MPCPCWPFKKAGAGAKLSTSGGQNGTKMEEIQTTGFTHKDGSNAQRDELVEELSKKVERLQGVANTAKQDLILMERNFQKKLIAKEEQIARMNDTLATLQSNNQDSPDVATQIRERDEEIVRLKEILDSIRSKHVAPPVTNKDRRLAVPGTKVETRVDLKKHDKTPEQRKVLREAILNNDFLKHLNEDQITEMIDYMQRSMPQNDVFIKEGTNGDRLYILESGRLDVTQGDTYLTSLEAGTVFGELAILYNCKRTATVTAKTPTKIWMLERNVYQNIMKNASNDKRTEVTDALRKVSQLKQIGPRKLGKIADALEDDVYKKGDYIIRQGESGDTFYIIMSGEVDVTAVGQEYTDSIEDPTPREKFIRTLKRGDYFGEKALRSDSGLRGANVIAKTSKVRCMTLDKKSFLQLIGNLADKDWDAPTKTKINKQSTVSARYSSSANRLIVSDKPRSNRPSSTFLEMTPRKMPSTIESWSLSDFEFVGVLGVGGFGRVELVRLRNQSDRSFALKCMKKCHIVETKQEDHIYSEKKIMRDSNCPFIVQLFKTFKNDMYVYMLMEACLGGELWTKLRDDGCFDDSRARFYTACVVEAMEYLHLRGIVYRDLKPENLLLDKKGYVKIVDFGFAKSINHGEKAWTFCGTPEYVAPEVILNKGHDIAVDYWALGILVFEMLTGNPPFNSSDAMKTYRMALRGIEAIEWPSKIKKTAQNLIRRLCRENPAERLGNLREGVKEIRNHRWFAGFHWESLRKGDLKAPYIPEIQDTSDLRNFDRFERESEKVECETSGWDKDF